MKSPDKPVVKYSRGRSGIRYKHTLLATIRGPEARAMIDASDAENGLGCCMNVYDYEKTTVQIWREQTMSWHDSKGKRVRITRGKMT